ncbi:MAG: CaiB/BaiF CoA-transferase family protein [Burkholderiaceae bacterium]|nr:CaiB/BaiF CoA-transferase family protein [Burkholderiaceae bacterium]MDO9090754.1 CaiB/BaiF CoA-transferase family protein [Burkholderiaceae bacterium]
MSLNPSETAPLAGLRVIEVASYIAAPVASTLLGDLGAEIVKVEAPGSGDAWRHAFRRPGLPECESNYLWQLAARNKQSIALDLKQLQGQKVLHRLVETADVFITNLPLHARAKLGLAYETLVQPNSRLIYASLTGYGEVGPEIHQKSYDHTAWWGRSGLMEQLRSEPDSDPVRPPVAMGDHTTALALYGTILSALFRRERTGKGAYVGTSLLSTGAWINSCAIQAALGGATFPPPTPRTETHNAMQCYYLCADDRWIILYVPFGEGDRGFSELMQALDMPQLASDPKFNTFSSRKENRKTLISAFDAKFREKGSHDWVQQLRHLGFTIEVMNRSQDASTDSQMLAASVIAPIFDAPGFDQTVSSPMWFRDVPARAARGAPELGGDTTRILAQNGLSADEIAALKREGVVFQAP